MNVVLEFLMYEKVTSPKHGILAKCLANKFLGCDFYLHTESVDSFLTFAEIVNMIAFKPLSRHLNLGVC